jgi:hypothetical protein
MHKRNIARPRMPITRSADPGKALIVDLQFLEHLCQEHFFWNMTGQQPNRFCQKCQRQASTHSYKIVECFILERKTFWDTGLYTEPPTAVLWHYIETYFYVFFVVVIEKKLKAAQELSENFEVSLKPKSALILRKDWTVHYWYSGMVSSELGIG